MLKLKDIFNIDISSKGGGKLYKKIMRKYNIPLKDVKEVKQEIVECSSGGGEGVKEYYYKFKEDMPVNVHIFYRMLLLFTVSKIDIIVPFLNGDKEYDGEVSVIALFLFADLNISTYFKISDIIQPIVSSVSDRGNNGITTGLYTEGDLFTKLEYSSNLLGDNPELLEMVNMVKDNAIAITKEEYESMITYKP